MADQQLDPQTAHLAVALQDRLLKGKSRKKFLSLVKEEFPNAPVPELDNAAPLEKDIAELREANKKLAERLDKQDKDFSLAAKMQKIQSERGYMDEAIPEILKLQAEKGISDFEVAADHYDRLQSKNKPTIIEPTGYMGDLVFDDATDDFKAWFENPDRMTDLEVGKVLTEARNGTLVG